MVRRLTNGASAPIASQCSGIGLGPLVYEHAQLLHLVLVVVRRCAASVRVAALMRASEVLDGVTDCLGRTMDGLCDGCPSDVALRRHLEDTLTLRKWQVRGLRR
jgi:hypothetical protein